MTTTRSKSVAIVGGGLAGISAAAALAEHGCQVELFEQGPHLGGRAGSFVDPRSGRLLDTCQHLALGCCTNLLDLCRRTGTDDCLQQSRTLHFLSPDGTQSDFRAVGWLPAPLHLLPALLQQRHLTLGERWQIVRALGRLPRSSVPPDLKQGVPRLACPTVLPALLDKPAVAPDSPATRTADESLATWLQCQGQSDRAIARFWSPVIQSALSETPDRVSLAAARKVFIDGFLAAREAYQLLLPRLSLEEWIDGRLGTWLANSGVTIHRGTRIKQIDHDGPRAAGVVMPDGARRPFDCVIAAVTWRQVGPLLGDALQAAIPSLSGVEKIQPAAITSVHLWFDRPLTPLPHAVLVDRLSQWVFADTAAAGQSGHHYQVVISASHALADDIRRAGGAGILDEVRSDLQAVWPAARVAQLLDHRSFTYKAAVFSPQPGVERLRPQQQTPIENLFLAGDWTATGWPATMEGAIRSGRLAAEALLRCLGMQERLLTADLPRGPLARWLYGANIQ